MLQIVVHRDNYVVSCGPYAAQERIVLPVIAHEVDTGYPWVLALELADNFPAAVGAAVVDENQFVLDRQRRQPLREPLHKFRQDSFASVNRHHDGNAGAPARVSWGS